MSKINTKNEGREPNHKAQQQADDRTADTTMSPNKVIIVYG